MIASAHVCPGQPSCGRLLACWTHNPPVLGSSPSRPTLSESRSDVSDLRKCVGLHDLVCQPRVQLCAARSGEMQVDPAPDHSLPGHARKNHAPHFRTVVKRCQCALATSLGWNESAVCVTGASHWVFSAVG